MAVTGYREKDPVYGPAITSMELWDIKLSPDFKPTLDLRLPGHRVPIVSLSDSGEHLYFYVSNLAVGLVSMPGTPRYSNWDDGIIIDALLVRSPGDPLFRAERLPIEQHSKTSVRITSFRMLEDDIIIPSDVVAHTLDYCRPRRILAIGSYGGSVDIWDISKQNRLTSIREDIDRDTWYSKCELSFSEDGAYISICRGADLSVWALFPQKRIFHTKSHNSVNIVSCKFIGKGLLATYHQMRPKDEISDSRKYVNHDANSLLEGIQLWHVDGQEVSKAGFIPLSATKLRFSSGADIIWKSKSEPRVLEYGKINLAGLKDE